MFLLLIPIFSSPAVDAVGGDTSLDALSYSALSSGAYYGSFSDIFVNPASLPLLNRAEDYQVSFAPGERYNTSLWGTEAMGYMQNLTSELQGTAVSGPVALSAKVSSRLDNRTLRSDGGVYYDIYSSFDIELAMAYSFLNHISIGARLGGGNSVGRLSKKMSLFIDAARNAWFSPYEKVEGSERFNLNVGTLIYFDNFTIGLVFDDLVASNTNFLKHLVSNTTLAVAFKGNEYNRNGDLNYLVPRLAVDMRGIGFDVGRSLTACGDLTLQLLKDVLLDVGVKYSYMISEKDEKSSEITVTVLGTYGDFSLLFNVVLFQNNEENFRPSVVLTYST